MPDFLICVRNIERGRFGAEPGSTHFLKLPGSAKTPTPRHSIKKKDWIARVLREAVVRHNPRTKQDCGDILVFVHGYNNKQEEILERHRQIKDNLKAAGYKGAVVSFDWPSDDNVFYYLEDRSDAKGTAIKLVDDCIKVFSILQRPECEINVHLLAHSTGAYVVREAFDDADDRRGIARTNWTVSQVLFIAADVSAKSMSADSPRSSSLYRHCARLTNYSNPFDWVLKSSNAKRVGLAPRLGRVGLPDGAACNAVNVNCGPYYDRNKDAMKVGGVKSHSWHIGDKTLMKDMFLTLSGDIDRNVIPTRSTDHNGNLILKG